MNLRWSWHPETRDLFESVDPELWAASGGDPQRLLGAVTAERLDALAADSAFLARLTAASAGPARLPERAAVVPGPGRRPRGDRVLQPGVRHHRGAAAVLRRPRHPRRRPPQGRVRPRRPHHRRRAAVPGGVLHPVAVGRRLAARAVPVGRPVRAAADAAHRRRRHPAEGRASGCPVAGRSRPRSGWRRWAGSRCCCSTPTWRRTTPTPAGSPTGSTAAAPTTGCCRRCCSASAASARSAPTAR